ncbi:universal stress protein [Lunatibacter salilacus]|uniref:universal stress protein n=1 Tax=Lunatibacter salilacus TaxID=2483804 RepID=UPI00131B9896|nr:universal stress protein [Lunatibacter salilacus]
MKKILYTTDFSKNAESAFRIALNLAKKHHAEFHLLHVFDIPTSWNYPYTAEPLEMERQAIRESKEKLTELFDRYSSDSDDELKPVYHVIENPSVVDGVLSCIDEVHPYLVVIGTKGGSKAREIIVGSTTKSLLSKSPVPVLAIPENSSVEVFEKVLYASDLYEDDIKALEQLNHIMEPFQPGISVVHISSLEANSEAKKIERFKEMLNERNLDKNIELIHYISLSIPEGLESFLSKNRFDLLVMLEKERHGLVDHLFHKDLVKKMEFRTKIPLLSFNQHNVK